jgi:hypothetical protein
LNCLHPQGSGKNDSRISEDDFGWGLTENYKSPSSKTEKQLSRKPHSAKKGSTGLTENELSGSRSSSSASSSSSSSSDDEEKSTLNDVDEMTQEKKEDSDNEQVCVVLIWFIKAFKLFTITMPSLLEVI